MVKSILSEKFYENKLLDNCVIDPTTQCWNWIARSLYIKYYHRLEIVYRISAHLFLDFDLDSSLLICHKCDNRKCINPEHLFIGTYQDNANDMKFKNRQAKGVKVPTSKLNENQVLEIRKLFKEGVTRHDLMVKYNVSYNTIINILKGNFWKHVTLQPSSLIIG